MTQATLLYARTVKTQPFTDNFTHIRRMFLFLFLGLTSSKLYSVQWALALASAKTSKPVDTHCWFLDR